MYGSSAAGVKNPCESSRWQVRTLSSCAYDSKRTRRVRAGSPGVLRGFPPSDAPAATLGLEALYVPRVVADEIRAGSPRREDHLDRTARIRHRQLDLEEMGSRARHRHGVAQRHSALLD